MVMQLSKLITLLSIILLFISCKNDAQKRTISTTKVKELNQKIDFFDKKYFQGYLMSVDESTPAEHPFYSYLDCKKEGYFSVHFIPKTERLISYWKDKYFQENNYEYDDLKTENRIISQLLANKYDFYNIFCIQITNKYLDISNGCTEESVNLKNDAVADIFLYNPSTKEWVFQKNTKIEILPQFADNNFFFNKFPTIKSFSNENIKKEDSLKNNKNMSGENIFIANNNGLVIKENLLNEIYNKSDIDHGKTASQLNSYVLNLLSKRKNREKIPFSDESLFKIIAYTINTIDPVYYKYFDSEGAFGGEYSFGDSKGGASLSEALSLSKLLSTEDMDNMSRQFRENNYYNLQNLKDMLKKTSWFEL